MENELNSKNQMSQNRLYDLKVQLYSQIAVIIVKTRGVIAVKKSK